MPTSQSPVARTSDNRPLTTGRLTDLSRNTPPRPETGVGTRRSGTYSSVGPRQGLSRLRRYRVGNCTFVTIRGQGNLPDWWVLPGSGLDPSQPRGVKTNLYGAHLIKYVSTLSMIRLSLLSTALNGYRMSGGRLVMRASVKTVDSVAYSQALRVRSAAGPNCFVRPQVLMHAGDLAVL